MTELIIRFGKIKFLSDVDQNCFSGLKMSIIFRNFTEKRSREGVKKVKMFFKMLKRICNTCLYVLESDPSKRKNALMQTEKIILETMLLLLLLEEMRFHYTGKIWWFAQRGARIAILL